MNNSTGEIPEINASIANGAVSVYNQDDALEDFPVLKAFQQYIDAEQEKSRKRMLSLCIFFGALMGVVVTVFVVLLISISSRNQLLNDRMIELALQGRTQSSAPVVVQPQDSAAILALTSRLEEIQNNQKIAEKKAQQATERAEKAEKEKQAIVDASKPQKPSAEEIEIKQLRALLVAEREKNTLEKEKQRQAELEQYRRKHYPELYAAKPAKNDRKPAVDDEDENDEADEDLKEIDAIIEDVKAIKYFEDDDEPPSASKTKKSVKKTGKNPTATTKSEKVVENTQPKKEYSIPVDIKGSSSSWQIPND